VVYEPLRYRSEQVQSNGKLSKFKPIENVVPCGSILDPFWFLLFINDLSNSSTLLY